MSRDEALAELNRVRTLNIDPPARERRTAIAQVEATLYVGEQLERLTDLVRAGFKISAAGDTFGDLTRWVEPIGDES